MKKLMALLMTVMWATGLPAQSTTQITAKVKSDRVNLRARPNLQSETVVQVSAGDVLSVRSVEEGWVQVVPPDATDFWVHKDFVVDDKVPVNRLNVRSGAGINYNVVGSFAKGDVIQRRGSFGEWLKVAPPADAALWVSLDLVEVLYPLPDMPEPRSAPAAGDFGSLETNIAPLTMTEPMVAPSDFVDKPAGLGGAIPSATPPAWPVGLKLVPLDGQGRDAVREGELKRAPTLFANPPSNYRLVRREGKKLVTMAYVIGNANQLEGLLGEYLVVRGKEYWVEKRREPVIVIEAIEKRFY